MTEDVLLVLAQWGPIWLIVIFVVWQIVPRVTELIAARTQAEREMKDESIRLEQIREERKQRESTERSQRDGQWLQLQQSSKAVIENNTAAVKLMTASFEKLDQDRQHTHQKLDRLSADLREHDERASALQTETKIISMKIGGTS